MEAITMPRSSSAHARLSHNADETFSDSRRHIELFKRLKEAETENKKLKHDYLDIQELYEKLQARIVNLEERQVIKPKELNETQVAETETNVGHDTLKEDAELKESDIDNVIKKLEEQEREQIARRLENNVLEKVCESLASRIDIISQEHTEFKQMNDTLTKQVKDQRNEIDKREKEVEMLLNDKNKANDENKR